MTLSRADIAIQVRYMMGEDPQDITYDGQTVTGFQSNMVMAERQLLAGASDNYSFSLYTIAADWTSAPDKGDVVTIDSVEYRVIKALDYQKELLLRLDLGAKYESN